MKCIFSLPMLTISLTCSGSISGEEMPEGLDFRSFFLGGELDLDFAAIEAKFESETRSKF